MVQRSDGSPNQNGQAATADTETGMRCTSWETAVRGGSMMSRAMTWVDRPRRRHEDCVEVEDGDAVSSVAAKRWIAKSEAPRGEFGALDAPSVPSGA